MEFFGIGLHIIVALFFAIHAIRSGRELYWLLILFMFPLLGSVVYFVAIFLPAIRSGTGLQRNFNRVANTAMTSIDPGRGLREAKTAVDFSPTAQNQWRYADALLADNQIAAAVEQFELCLQGPFANDLEIQFAAARAHLRFDQQDRALALLLAIRTNNGSFRAEAVTLMLAQIYAQQNNHALARQEFEQALTRFGSVEARAEFALWAAQQGDLTTARNLYAELKQLQKSWSRATSSQYSPLMIRLDGALKV